MIKPNIRNTIRILFEQGKKKKEIARIMNITIKTVRKILHEDNEKPDNSNKISNIEGITIELLENLNTYCHGYKIRMHEILQEEYKINIGYSYLTQLMREHSIGEIKNQRCSDVPDVPGDEMQHDTSTYYVKINGKNTKIICSGIYFRYSKMRYIKFYMRFNRFTMKCFFHEALLHFGYSCKVCIIDNTNLAVLYGSGKKAVMVPEMEQFAKTYGFTWKAHEIRHSNRKAGTERNFRTITTNFLPGRIFTSWKDLNEKAKQWATVRYPNRYLSGMKLLPTQLFEQEKPYLIKLSQHIPPPYKPDKRIIDQYGYISFNGNYYWIPGKTKGTVEILEYADTITVCQKQQNLITYTLPDWELKNQKFYPPDVKRPRYEPRQIKKLSIEEEKALQSISPVCTAYLDFIKSKECRIRQKNRYIRNMYLLSKKLTTQLFIQVVKTSFEYRISDFQLMEQLSVALLYQEHVDFTDIVIDDNFDLRKSYQDGKYSGEADLKKYSDFIEDSLTGE